LNLVYDVLRTGFGLACVSDRLYESRAGFPERDLTNDKGEDYETVHY